MSEPIIVSLALSPEQVDAIAKRVSLVVANEVIKALKAAPAPGSAPPASSAVGAATVVPLHGIPDFDPAWNGSDVIRSGKNEGKRWSQLPEGTVDYLADKPNGPIAARKERARRIQAATSGRAYAR